MQLFELVSVALWIYAKFSENGPSQRRFLIYTSFSLVDCHGKDLLKVHSYEGRTEKRVQPHVLLCYCSLRCRLKMASCAAVRPSCGAILIQVFQGPRTHDHATCVRCFHHS
uniref:Uncharacterized protein n=1 Tax=Physcomitrium patens TaxID=3218 RepID=A0A2K1INY8_PHYPA|nr:hypothetical protein PHYPA_027311 [Physcomitrium patens]